MPELPEVETIVRCLRPALAGKRLGRARLGDKRMRRAWASEWSKLERGRKVLAVRRRGKWIVVELAGGNSLLVHLGMSGRLQVVRADDPLAEHTHFRFCLSPGKLELRFRDPRRFGSIGLKRTEEVEAFFTATGLGPEPFNVAPGLFHERLLATRRVLKAVLLDQSVLAGVGNIYADESLYEARLHPETRGSDVDPGAARRLVQAVQRVLRRAIERKGSTIRDYFYDENGRGEFQNEFRVYQQQGEPCRRCRTLIVQVRLAGRATHYCPRCQREL